MERAARMRSVGALGGGGNLEDSRARRPAGWAERRELGRQQAEELMALRKAQTQETEELLRRHRLEWGEGVQ